MILDYKNQDIYFNSWKDIPANIRREMVTNAVKEVSMFIRFPKGRHLYKSGLDFIEGSLNGYINFQGYAEDKVLTQNGLETALSTIITYKVGFVGINYFYTYYVFNLDKDKFLSFVDEGNVRQIEDYVNNDNVLSFKIIKPYGFWMSYDIPVKSVRWFLVSGLKKIDRNLSRSRMNEANESAGDYVINEKGVITAYTGADRELEIPDNIDGVKVTEIGDSAFAKNKTLEIVILSNVSVVGTGAFSNCINLKTVKVPKEVREIKDNAFSGCRNLEEFEVPYEKNIKWNPEKVFSNIGKKPFKGYVFESASYDYFGKTNVEENYRISGTEFREYYGDDRIFTIPDGVTKICDSAFENSELLNEIYIPDSVVEIGSYAFSNCTNLKKVRLPERLTYIYSNTFSDCKQLTNIQLPDTLLYIGDNAFSDCVSLENIIIPDKVSYIGYYAFAGCVALNSILLPEKLKSIEYNTFEDCTSLKHIYLPDSLVIIDNYAFYNCSSLKEITLPENIVEVGLGVFDNCSMLKKVEVLSTKRIRWEGELSNKTIDTLIIPKELHYNVPGTFNNVIEL